MNEIFLQVSTKYTSIPPHCKIYCCDELIFDGVVSSNIHLNFQTPINKIFKLEIIKNGKTLDLVKKKHKQEIVIEKLSLNGIELKIKVFGFFENRNNDFVKDNILQTNTCKLNGRWIYQLPEQELIGYFDKVKIKNIFGKLNDADIACFGCSETQGLHIEPSTRWPNVLLDITGRDVKNYGIGGSNINEITAFVKYYVENFKCNNVIMLLPHTFRKQIHDKKNNAYLNVGPTHESNKMIMMHGEEHSIANLSGKLINFLTEIGKKTKICFSLTHTSEHHLFSKTPCKKFMLPLIDKNLFPTGSDNIHGGESYNKSFAETVVNYI